MNSYPVMWGLSHEINHEIRIPMEQPTQWNADGELYDQVYPNDISEFPWKKGRLYRDVSKARFTENFPMQICHFCKIASCGTWPRFIGWHTSAWHQAVRAELKVGQPQIYPKHLPERWKIFGGRIHNFLLGPKYNMWVPKKVHFWKKTSLV